MKAEPINKNYNAIKDYDIFKQKFFEIMNQSKIYDIRTLLKIFIL